MDGSTRTTNPLPFEHMEPHRFEDLIRQLAYDFRAWRSLEATGRSGADEGYDIRGWEIVPTTELETSDGEDDEEVIPSDTDRRWLIQCKREKSLGPAKVKAILDSISKEERENLYGLVIAASCNVSKKSRDLLREQCRDAGIAECHVWSRAEIEDMIFQPKNDGLLFAYFGISLTIRRRSVKSRLRFRLAAKRKAYRALGHDDWEFRPVLLRDPEDDRYPYYNKDTRREDHRWRVVAFVGQHPHGLKITAKQHPAYADLEGVHWDIADKCNTHNIRFNDPWQHEEEKFARLLSDVNDFSSTKVDQRERGIFEVEWMLPYKEILDIDADGDSFFQEPHIYVAYVDGKPPFSYGYATIKIEPIATEVEGRTEITTPGRTVYPKIEDRVVIFPKKFRGMDR